jgi:protein-tyrosine-phosphatase
VLNAHRKYGLRIWGFGLAYYFFYTPYSGLTKALSGGLVGAHGPLRGEVILPLSALATAVGMFCFITAMGWWKYAGHREVLGITVPFPRRLTFLSGVCMAIIIATTTLAFSFGGLSIVLVLVLLRGGTLIIAPIVDRIVGRRVRWFSWAAMIVSLLAVWVVLGDAANYKLTIASIIDIAAYLMAYFFKLQFMSRLAKSDDMNATRRYFVEEQMVASPLLVIALMVMASIGAGDVMQGFRAGLTTTFLTSQAAVFAALIGLFYAGLCVCTTMIFLDRRENTYCVPMHCGSSMLSGMTASWVLATLLNQKPVSTAQMVSTGFIVVALGFLSPLHHFDRVLASLKKQWQRLQSAIRPEQKAIAGVHRLKPVPPETPALPQPKLILFVCSGNTCRSPMAAAIAKTEIAARFDIPFENEGSAPVKTMSAGLTARPGEPMTNEAKEALRQLGFHPNGHRSRNLTLEMAEQADRIFCMTSSHRAAVIDLIPAGADKTKCLDPEGDIADPINGELGVYVDCASHLHSLVRLRFDELGLASSSVFRES